MKNFTLTWLVLLLFSVASLAQFAPPAGQSGSTAIHCDSSVFVAWASRASIERGYQQIDQLDLGLASYGQELSAVGKADNDVVSLGDGGVATLSFISPICDKDGPDFAVFENSFNDLFLELAFVEVSSDGEHFFRFPAISLTQTEIQTDGFSQTDATLIHNFAGKYRAFYGTPFDLADLEDNPFLDRQSITMVRIVDVVGCINPEYATYDVENHIVNDPWPTPFYSSGFDLDAVGVIHDLAHSGVNEVDASFAVVYPNPVSSLLKIELENNSFCEVYNALGQSFMACNLDSGSNEIDFSEWHAGLYFIRLENHGKTIVRKVFKQ
jgi:hypothetical protein